MWTSSPGFVFFNALINDNSETPWLNGACLLSLGRVSNNESARIAFGLVTFRC